jgi:hypothetical protein
VEHKDGTTTLVIPVAFAGVDAKLANVSAITARANGSVLLDPKVTITLDVVSTAIPIKGKLNRLERLQSRS